MKQLSPDTRADRSSCYHYDDTIILGFSHTQLSGIGCPDLGDFLITPALSGAVTPLPHGQEEARPSCYKVSFPDRCISAENIPRRCYSMKQIK